MKKVTVAAIVAIAVSVSLNAKAGVPSSGSPSSGKWRVEEERLSAELKQIVEEKKQQRKKGQPLAPKTADGYGTAGNYGSADGYGTAGNYGSADGYGTAGIK